MPSSETMAGQAARQQIALGEDKSAHVAVIEGDGALVLTHRLPTLIDCDVVVAGGGVAGLGAAVASARTGARTVLIESNSFLGGTATASMMSAIVASPQAGGIGVELLERLAMAGGAPVWDGNPARSETTPFDNETYKQVALDMIEEAGVEMLLSAVVVGPVLDENSMRGVEVMTKSGLVAILARQVVDCTGDADIAARAGAPMAKGREEDGAMRPFSLLFRVGGLDLYAMHEWAQRNPDQIQPAFRDGTVLEVGNEKVLTRISGFYNLMEQAKKRGEIPDELHYFRLENCWMDRGIALINTTRIYGVDGTDARDITRGEVLGRKQIRQLMHFITNSLPGGRNAYMIDVAPKLGIRETRRIVGQASVRDEDVYRDTKVDAPIMTFTGNFPSLTEGKKAIDIHMPDPIEGSLRDPLERDPASVKKELHTFQIPYGALLPQGIENLLVAGRTISVSHNVDGYTRNQVVAMRMGEVAGTAAALSIREGVTPRLLNYELLKARLAEGGMDDVHTAYTRKGAQPGAATAG